MRARVQGTEYTKCASSKSLSDLEPTTNLELTLKHTLFEASSFKWHINWVPGHAGVAGNEVADGEAGRGSHLSQQGLGLIGLTQRARDGNFLPG